MNPLLVKMQSAGILTDADASSVDSLLQQGQAMDDALLAAKGVSPEKLLRYLAGEFQVPYVDVETNPPAKAFLLEFPIHILMAHRLLPYAQQDGAVLVASSKLFDTTGLDELRLACGKPLRLALAPAAEIDR